MPYDLNKVLMSGNLTDDPKIYSFSNGDKAANFSIAINKTWTDHNGTDHKTTTYVDCRASGKYMQKKVEAIEKYLKRGRKILVEGSLELNKYTKDGNQISKMRVLVDDFHFMDSKHKNEDNYCCGEGEDSFKNSQKYSEDTNSQNVDNEENMFPIIDSDNLNYDELS